MKIKKKMENMLKRGRERDTGHEGAGAKPYHMKSGPSKKYRLIYVYILLYIYIYIYMN
jgi:hypothetical protein